MTSSSVKFSATSVPNSNRFSKLHATPPQTVAVPSSGAAEIAAERLEPRVEERDGYWVLKEKFRQGINPAEKAKIEKEPMKLFTENGIEDLAKISLEEIEKSKLTKDDIDVRLKWLGLFHRRKHHCKYQKNPVFSTFMIPICLTYILESIGR